MRSQRRRQEPSVRIWQILSMKPPLLAVKRGRNAVSQTDLFEAVEVVLAGKEKKDRILSQKERQIVTYHEVGHALSGRFAEEYGAGTEDYDRSENYGGFRIRDAGS